VDKESTTKGIKIMSNTLNKIDFAVIIKAKKGCNPNGDPLAGNQPRRDINQFGEISDVAIKRKIRNRVMEAGEDIFMQSDDNVNDGIYLLKERYEKNIDKKIKDDKKKIEETACKKWYDVRAFGQVFAYSGKQKKDGGGVSVGIRGPVTIQSACSLAPIAIETRQITKSASNDSKEKKGSDTMGTQYLLEEDATYVFYGAVNPRLAERTGFTKKDAEILKSCLVKLFENDASSARPEGTMRVQNLIWWEHDSITGQESSAKIHDSLKIEKDGSFKIEKTSVKPEVIEGF